LHYTIANQGEVNLLLEGTIASLPAAISRDDNLGLGVYQAVFNASALKPPK